MARKLQFQRKRHTIPASELVESGSVDLFYSVQQALQNEGVNLIDLHSGDIIEGQVNISSVGLIDGNKPVKLQRQMGFVQATSSDSIEFEKRDLDAILVFDQNAQKQGGPLYLLIQVVDYDDMDFWNQTSLAVARRFIVNVHGSRYPEVFFGVTNLSRSNGTDSSARNAALRKIRNYSLHGVDSISDTEIPFDYDFYDDDDLEC